MVTPEVVVEGTDLDLTHLHEAVRPIASLPAAERLGYVRADRWIGYPAANEALKRLETLLAWPTKQRMPAAGRADQQRQVDDHREVRPRSPGDLAPRP